LVQRDRARIGVDNAPILIGDEGGQLARGLKIFKLS
jgi:hypothetical protein